MAGKDATKRRRTRWIISLILVAGIGFGVLKVVLFATAKPMISINYAAEYNEMVRPADYDPNADASAEYREAFARLPTIPDGVDPLGHLWEYDPASAEYKMLESWLASCEEAVGLLHKAGAKPCFWGRVSSIDPNRPLFPENFDYVAFGQAAHCLRRAAEYRAAHGDTAEAFRCVVTGFRMAGHLNHAGRQFFGMGQIVEMITHGTARDLLVRTDVDSTVLRDAQRQLEGILAAGAPPSFRSDGIVLRDIIQRSFTDDGKGDGHVLFQTILDCLRRQENPKSELGEDFAYFGHCWTAWNHPSRRETIQTVDRLAEAATQLIQQTPWERHSQGVDSLERLCDICRHNAFLRVSAADRALFWAITNHDKNLTSFESLIAAMAILRFHKDKESWPASLEELAATGYIRRMPMDPYGGKPLGYARTKDSFILYSCGDNFRDDGGAPIDPRPTVVDGDKILWPIEGSKK
jgi:hypothetical protein